MTKEQKNKIINFLNDQITQAEFRAKAYVFDEDGKKRPQRNIYKKINKYLDDFLERKRGVKWLTLTGLRGAGKTTLMSQCYFDKKNSDTYKLYLSMDQVVQLFGITLQEVLLVYEELIGVSFEKLDKPLLVFLDEVQYDENWGVTLKSLHDRALDKIFIFATGSAALEMNKNIDIARRTIYEKLFPLSFTEYIKIKNNKEENKFFGHIKDAVFNSKNAKDAYNVFLSLEKKINSYFIDIDKNEIDKYVRYGSLPFMIALNNEALVYDQINKTLDKMVNSDVAKIGKFNSEIISKIPAILYAVADMDQINYSKISKDFEISRPKVMEIFEILEKTETLIRIFPYGSHLSQVRKPSKYLFSAPAFRSMYYNLIGNVISKDNAKGKLLEDTVAMYIARRLYKVPNTSITYDSMRGGADFIIKIDDKKIVVEVGAGSKKYKQIRQTAIKVGANYSLIISNDDLKYSEEDNAVKIPLKYFLLM